MPINNNRLVKLKQREIPARVKAGSKVTTLTPPQTTHKPLDNTSLPLDNTSLPPGQHLPPPGQHLPPLCLGSKVTTPPPPVYGQRSQHLPSGTMRRRAVLILLECILVVHFGTVDTVYNVYDAS